MPRGGKRPGSGRKPGKRVFPKTRAVANRVIAEGASPVPPPPIPATNMTPLDIMVANARHFYGLALQAEAILAGMTAEDLTGQELDEKGQFEVLKAEVMKAADLRQLAGAAARDAAPFVHARLATLTPGQNQTEDHVPLHKRLAIYTQEDAIRASEGKVVEIKRAREK